MTEDDDNEPDEEEEKFFEADHADLEGRQDDEHGPFFSDNQYRPKPRGFRMH